MILMQNNTAVMILIQNNTAVMILIHKNNTDEQMVEQHEQALKPYIQPDAWKV